MKVTDYIIEFLIGKKVTDIFGYPGGVICHLIDSATKYSQKIHAHINYHEQASAFAACGYAQETGNIGVAYSTSGPGATNLVTGIANAYFDSTPTIFLTGQVDTYGLKGERAIRQGGFQETDIVSMVRNITKYAVRIDDPNDIRYMLEKAFYYATEGNPGPVLLDLPADVQRAEIDEEKVRGFKFSSPKYDLEGAVKTICEALIKARRPCFLIGHGVKQAGQIENIRKLVYSLEIPTVCSMPAFDILPYKSRFNYGFIGANGHRYGNFVLGKSDLIISIGSRLDLKQVGNNRKLFAIDAQIIRIDIDDDAFSYPVHNDEIKICMDIKQLLPKLIEDTFKIKCKPEWNNVCAQIKDRLEGYDDEEYTILLRKVGETIENDVSMTVDVGQSEVWVAQQLHVKENQKVYMSAGHGAMGFSLPAAIGAYYGSGRPVYSFNGDGGVQMNLQELQYLSREQIPVHVVIMNNHALGMIRGFQEANFNKNYSLTIEGSGYSAPDFCKLASAYSLQYILISCEEHLHLLEELDKEKPSIIEIALPTETSLNPNFGRNGLIQDQRPYIDRTLYMELMEL